MLYCRHIPAIAVLSALWFLALGTCFGTWYLNRNDLQFASDALHTGESFGECQAQFGAYKHLYVMNTRQPASAMAPPADRRSYAVTLVLRDHFYWSEDSYLVLQFENDRLVNKTCLLFHDLEKKRHRVE